MKQKPTAPQLPRLTASQRANLLMSLGVIKAKGIRPYRVSKRPPPTDKSHSRANKPIQCVQTGEVFPSITAAAHAHGVQPSNLSWHLKGYNSTVGGRTYTYIQPEQLPATSTKTHGTTPRPIRCVNDGLEFRSINACAKHYGIATSGLHNHLNGTQKSVGGKQFEYV